MLRSVVLSSISLLFRMIHQSRDLLLKAQGRLSHRRSPPQACIRQGTQLAYSLSWLCVEEEHLQTLPKKKL